MSAPLHVILPLTAAGMLLVIGCERPTTSSKPAPVPAPEAPTPPALPTEPAPPALELTRARLKELYERARQAGETVPDDVTEWARTDAARIGDWDYEVLTLTELPAPLILDHLQRMGSNRWECFWVEATPDGRRFYFKRPQRSYLQMAGHAAKLVPLPSGNNAP